MIDFLLFTFGTPMSDDEDGCIDFRGCEFTPVDDSSNPFFSDKNKGFSYDADQFSESKNSYDADFSDFKFNFTEGNSETAEFKFENETNSTSQNEIQFVTNNFESFSFSNENTKKDKTPPRQKKYIKKNINKRKQKQDWSEVTQESKIQLACQAGDLKTLKEILEEEKDVIKLNYGVRKI